jgi:hypothetical protein
VLGQKTASEHPIRATEIKTTTGISIFMKEEA